MRNLLLASGSILVAVSTATAAPAWAADSPAAAVPEVIITAQKRTERLADAPVAASVVQTDKLAQYNVDDISQLSNIVPSVSMNGTFNGRVPIGIRGVETVSNEGTVGLASGVAVMIDGVTVPSDSYAGNQLEDVARIEVLKGPQSTLGGRTAAAGVINIVTKSPSATPTGSISVTATSDNEERLNAFLAGPISGMAEFSLSGWANHITYPIVNDFNGAHSYQDTYGVRGKLLLKPTENLDVTLSGRLSSANSLGGNFTYSYVTPGANLLCGLACPPGWPLTQALLLPGITPSFQNLHYNSPVTNGGSKINDADASINIDYRIGAYTLSSDTAYQHETSANIQDLFAVGDFFWNTLTGGHAPPFFNIQNQNETVSQLSEELKLVSPAEARFNYVVGLYYSDTKVTETVDRLLIPALEHLVVTPDTQTYDIYGRSNYAITDSTKLVTGLRVNHDVIGYTYNQTVFVPYGPQSSSASQSSTTVVGDITLQQKLSSNSMAYATYARGYSPGAYNTSLPLPDNNPMTPVGEETIDHFEIGSKGSYFDHRLTLDLALFDTVYKNFQIQTYENNPLFINPPLILTAAGQATTRGLEVDSTWRPTDTLRISVDAAFIDSKFNSYPNAPCFGGQTTGCVIDPVTLIGHQNIDGRTMPNAPTFKLTVGAEQRVPLDRVDLAFTANYSYRNSAQMLADQNPQAILPAYGILNLGASMANKAGTLTASVFVNNVTNQHYMVDVEDFWTAPWGGANTVVSQPARDASRYFGVRLSARY
jgi:iron complex outermembrane receptor protein